MDPTQSHKNSSGNMEQQKYKLPQGETDITERHHSAAVTERA
jgi:hypothetical protein